MAEESLSEWLHQRLLDSTHRVLELSCFVISCGEGMELLRAAPDLARAMAQTDDLSKRPSPDEIEAHPQVKEAQQQADLCSDELDRGMPTLSGMACVYLHAILEGLTREIIVEWIVHKPECKRTPAIQKIKGSLAGYEELSAHDRALHLLERFEESEVGRGGGLGRFEKILSLIGVSIVANDPLRKQVYMLSHLRHLVAHRAGRIDRSFLDAVGSDFGELGSEAAINRSHAFRFAAAGIEYIALLRDGLGKALGVDMRQGLEYEGGTAAEVILNLRKRKKAESGPQV